MTTALTTRLASVPAVAAPTYLETNGLVQEPRFATVRDVTFVVFKYRTRILSVFLATVVTVYTVLSLVPEKWDAHVGLLVQLGRENSAVPVAVVKEAFVQGGVQIQQVNSEIAALRAPALLAESVDAIGVDRFFAAPPRPTTLFGWLKFGLKAAYRGVKRAYTELLYFLNLKTRMSNRDAAIAAIGGGLTVTNAQGSQSIDAVLRMTDPVLAAEVLNRLVGRHLQRRAAYHREAGATGLFRETVATYEEQLTGAEKRLLDFRTASGISALAQQRDTALTQLGAIDEKMQGTEAAATRVTAEIAALGGRIRTLPAGITAEQTTKNPVGQSLAERLAELYQKRSRLAGTYRPDSRFVEQVEQEIASLEAQMQTQRRGDYGSRTVGVNPTRSEAERRVVRLEAELVGLQAELGKQSEQRERIQQTLDSYDRLEGEARELERRRQLAEEMVTTYRKKADEARIVDEMSERGMTNLIVVSPATPPAQPSSPRKMLLMGVALLGGLLAGVGAAFAADALDRSVRYGRDLERLGVPVLVTIPNVAGGFRPTARLVERRTAEA